MKQKNNIIKKILTLSIILIGFSTISLNYTYADVDDTTNVNKVVSQITSVQAPILGLPTLPVGKSQKGRIGEIISRLFDTNGKIGNRFLRSLNGIGTSNNNYLLKWTGGIAGKFINSLISDNGSIVNIDGKLKIKFGGAQQLRFEAGNEMNFYTNDSGNTPTTLFVQYKGGNTNIGNRALYVKGNAVQGAGNVGIGKNNPTAKLDVNGKIKEDGTLLENKYLGINEKATSSTNSDNSSKLQGKTTETTLTNTDTKIPTSKAVIAYVNNNGSLWSKNGTSAYYNAGNVGIGTNNPSQKLDVVGNIEVSGGDYRLQDNNGDWSIGGTGENLEFREPEDGNKLWAYIQDDWGLRMTGAPNIQANGTIRADNGFQVDGTTVIGGDAWIEGNRIRQNTINSSKIQNDSITESDISNSFKARDSDKLDGINGASFLRSDADDYLYEKIIAGDTNKRRAGMYGIYDSHKIGHIWSMGTAYQIPENGSNFGNLYGLAYKHTNNTTGGTMAGGHQMVWTQNGTPYAAMGNDIWAKNNIKANGNVYASAFIYSSDRRLKKDISVIDSALEKIKKLEGVNFRWKKDGTKEIGLIAQDVEKIFPELVVVKDEAGMKGVKYGNLVAPLVEATKELSNKIDDLFEKYLNNNEKIKKQEEKIKNLEQRLEELEKILKK